MIPPPSRNKIESTSDANGVERKQSEILIITGIEERFRKIIKMVILGDFGKEGSGGTDYQ